VVLLFDEADSLFGRRTERKETGERYANMLTNFLLTRIETHPGVVVLATNSRERIDNAFTRRLDQIIEVPLPGFEERLGLWRSHLGERGPGDAVCRALASYCDLAGGQIRNAVLTASALADGRAIGLAELLAALRTEYRKVGRVLPAQVERMAGAEARPGGEGPTASHGAGTPLQPVPLRSAGPSPSAGDDP
jgi:SpoVK/Ycf46/Vps4 family AAA+-type ATPase